MPSPSYVPVIATGRPFTATDITATSSVVVDSDGTAINAVDRGVLASFAAYVLRTAGTDRWAIQMASGSSNLQIVDSANGVTVMSITPGAAPVLAVLGLVDITGAAAATRILGGLVAGDTVDRYSVRADGQTDWGPGGGVARDTTLRRSAAGVLATDGSFSLASAGGGLLIKEGGAAATMGAATMVAGTVTVATTKVTATSRIQLTVQSLGTVTAPKAVAVTGRVAGTSFTITSADATDTSVVAWTLIEPAP